MDSDLDRDLAEIILETYMEQCREDSKMGFHRKAETALELFQLIRNIIVDECLNKESLLHQNNVTVGPSDSVYRRLESVNDFLMSIKHKILQNLRSLHTVIEEIRSIMRDLLERVKPFMLSFSDIVTGFKISTPEVYTFSHQIAYNRLGGILHVHLEILKEDIADLTTWKPTKSFYRNYAPISINIEPGQRVITLTTHEIHFREFEMDAELKDQMLKALIRTIPQSILSTKLEDLDWSFDKNGSVCNIRSPLRYIFKADKTITQVLKVGKHFQKQISVREILPVNLARVMIMCKRLLICGKNILHKIKFSNVRKLFDIVFSVLDRVYLLTIKSLRDRSTFQSISHQCSSIRRLALRFKEKFDQHQDGSFEDYIDIVYKFIIHIFIPIRDKINYSFLFFTLHEIELVIHRTFLPTEIGGRICNWDNKFSRYKTLEELVNNSETNSCCSICQKPIDVLKPETIAISENCDHLHCVPCLMENVNESMESDSVRRIFQCLHPSCKIFHYDFISGDLYDFFRNAVKAFTAAHGRISLPSNWRIKEPCREHGIVYPGECAYWGKICEVDNLKN